jgi:hypothetical protein
LVVSSVKVPGDPLRPTTAQGQKRKQTPAADPRNEEASGRGAALIGHFFLLSGREAIRNEEEEAESTVQLR